MSFRNKENKNDVSNIRENVIGKLRFRSVNYLHLVNVVHHEKIERERIIQRSFLSLLKNLNFSWQKHINPM